MIARGTVLQPEFSIDVEPSNTVLYDLSRYRNNGAMVGVGEPNAVQLPSGAWVWDYDGANDRITIPDSASLRFGLNSFTFEQWLFLRSDTATNTTFFSKIGTGWYVIKYYTGPARFYIRVDDNLANAVGGNYNVASHDSWLHLVVVIDRIANLMRVYYDTVAQATTNIAAVVGNISPTGPLYLGSEAGAGWIRATFPPPIMYNYLFTPGQIINNYEKTKHWFGVHD